MVGNSESESLAHEEGNETSPLVQNNTDEAQPDLSHVDSIASDTSANDILDGESDEDMFARYLDDTSDFDMPNRGDLREGTIVEVRPSELLVNIGVKRDGVVPQADLNRLEQDFVKNLSVGDTVTVTVSRVSDDDGSFILSIAEALQAQDWIDAEKLLNNGEHSVHPVIGFNKGGLTVEFNHLRGFVPASHLMDMPRNMTEDQRREELEKRIGSELRLKVIEVERRRRRLVMSEMLAEREFRAKAKEEIFERLSVGDVVDGVVRGLRPFGAFIDIGGADGLLHVSEIDWGPVAHPQNILQRGDKLEVQVIRLDPEKQQIALSRKRLLPNPWDGVEERYRLGDIVTAKITRVVEFGAFAQLEAGVEGLIHISELADISIAEPLKTVSAGDDVDVKILRVDARRQRIGLSHRQAIGAMPVNDDSDDISSASAADLMSSATAMVEESTNGEMTPPDTPDEPLTEAGADLNMEIVDELDGGQADRPAEGTAASVDEGSGEDT